MLPSTFIVKSATFCLICATLNAMNVKQVVQLMYKGAILARKSAILTHKNATSGSLASLWTMHNELEYGKKSILAGQYNV